MTEIRNRTLAGLTSLLVVGMLSTVGCSSSDDKDKGDAGATVSPGATITAFEGETPFTTGTPYHGSGQGWVDSTVTATGSLHIALESGPSTALYAYAYIGVPLSNPPVDASAVMGVTFTASGSVTGTGCQIQYSTVDQDHAETTNNGHCTSGDGCYPSSKVFPLTATPTPITVLWTDQTGGMGTGGAASTVNAAQILNLQWQVGTSPSVVGESCSADVTIDDVKWAQ